MSFLSTAGYLARRAAQKERVRILYRRALKDTLNWAVHRHLFYKDVFVFFIPISHFIVLTFLRSWTDFVIDSSNLPLIQASDLRERFEAHRHVVCSLSVPLIDFFFVIFLCFRWVEISCISTSCELIDIGVWIWNDEGFFFFLFRVCG